MNVGSGKVFRVCNECGAKGSDPNCWICYTKLSDTNSVIVAELAGDDRARSLAPRNSLSEHFFRIATFILLLLILLVGIGLTAEELGVGITYAIVVFPALLGTTLRLLSRRSKGDTVTWAQRFFTLLASGFIVFGILSLLITAATIALFAVCLWSMR